MLYLMDNARYNFTTFCVYHALYESRITEKGRCPKRHERREKVKETAVIYRSLYILITFRYTMKTFRPEKSIPFYIDIRIYGSIDIAIVRPTIDMIALMELRGATNEYPAILSQWRSEASTLPSTD